MIRPTTTLVLILLLIPAYGSRLPFVSPFFTSSAGVPESHNLPLSSWARSAVASSSPAILRNSPDTSSWGALANWSPSYLEAALGSRPLPSKTQPLSFANAGAYFARGCCPLSPRSPTSILSDPSEAGYASVPGEWMLEKMDPSQKGNALAADIGDTSVFARAVNPNAPDLEEPVHQVWLSSPNVITALHNDHPANFFLQIYGWKRFVLFPAELYVELGLFPRSSFFHRKPAVDIRTRPDLARGPCWKGPLPCDRMTQVVGRNRTQWRARMEALEGAGLVVTLHEGDVLYLPPLWFHSVLTLDASISTNFWIPTPAQDLLEGLWDISLPPQAGLWTALDVVDAVGGAMPRPDFVDSLQERWWMAMDMEGHFGAHPDDPDWKGYLEDERSAFFTQRSDLTDRDADLLDDIPPAASVPDLVHDVSSRALALVRDAQALGASDGVIEIAVSHWLESLVEHQGGFVERPYA